MVKTELWKEGGSRRCQHITGSAKLEGPPRRRSRSEVALSLEAIRQRTKEGLLGLLALCVGVGLNTLEVLFERELEEKIGEKGKHNPGRKASRHGHESRPVVLGGWKVRVSRPRARTVDGKEVVLESCEAVKKRMSQSSWNLR